MNKSEQAAVVRLVRHMQSLQRQIAKPTIDDATEEEVLKIIELLWEWTPTANKPLPSKHTMEYLIGLMRGCPEGEHGYIGSDELAGFLRKAAENHTMGSPLFIYLSEGWREMSDTELYDNGRWNYKETPLVKLLWEMHRMPHLFCRDGKSEE